jgi:hypothetical protein
MFNIRIADKFITATLVSHKTTAMTDTPILSSRRYKKNIANVSRLTVNELDHIEVKSFNYITDAEDAQMQYGVIAEDIANINPNLVQYDEQGQPKTVYYHRI